jgi:hypothetical protein
MNADGSDLHPITRIWGEYPSWSPDGRLIAFQSNRCACNGVNGEAEYDIYTVHPDGTGLRRLTSLPGEEGVGGWSTNGRLIAFGRNPDVWPGIFVMTRDGREVRRLRPHPPPGFRLRGVIEYAPGGGFVVGALEGEDPQTAPEANVWVSKDGRSTAVLVANAGGATYRPSGAGKRITRLRLGHRLRGDGTVLELMGHLTANGRAAPGRRVGDRAPRRHGSNRACPCREDRQGRSLRRADRAHGVPRTLAIRHSLLRRFGPRVEHGFVRAAQEEILS